MKPAWGLSLAAALCLAVAVLGCGRRSTATFKVKSGPQPAPAPVHIGGPVELPRVEPRAGTAVVVLVDTSGSMGQPVRDKDGKPRPKHQIAHEALERIIEQTAAWKKAHPDRTVQMGIYCFAGNVTPVLPVADFDEAKARDALKHVPRPNGGTAIGRALEEGFKGLYASGCARKFVVCVTDGENTVGAPPDLIAQQLHAQTEGEVKLEFVAFDVAAAHFKFLNTVNGEVVQASDGKQLEAELKQIYEQKILLEKEDKP